jgi:Skp family chaperone for outer membrane proteins
MNRKLVLMAFFAILTSTEAFSQSSPKLTGANISSGKHVLNQSLNTITIHNAVSNNAARIRAQRQQEIDRIREILRNLHRPRPVSP